MNGSRSYEVHEQLGLSGDLGQLPGDMGVWKELPRIPERKTKGINYLVEGL